MAIPFRSQHVQDRTTTPIPSTGARLSDTNDDRTSEYNGEMACGVKSVMEIRDASGAVNGWWRPEMAIKMHTPPITEVTTNEPSEC